MGEFIHNLDAVLEFGFVLKHPTWQLDDGPTWPTKFAITRKVNRVQALKLMDASDAYIVKDGEFFKVDPKTVSAAADAVIAGETPEGIEPATDVVKALGSFIVPAEVTEEAYGMLAGKICDVDFLDNVYGEVYFVNGYTGFSSNVPDQEGFFVVFKYVANDIYSNVKMSVFGGTGVEVAVDEGINVIRLGKDRDEAVAKSLVIKAECTIEDEVKEVTMIYGMKNLKFVEAAPAAPVIAPGEPVIPAPAPEPVLKQFVVEEMCTYKWVFLNGQDAVIKEEDGVTVLIVDGYEKFEVPADVRIVGGGKPGTSFPSSQIIMDSGKVSHLYGGGLGESYDGELSADVANTFIKMNGGEAKYIYGGGILRAKCDSTTIILEKDAVVEGIIGGGHGNINNQFTTNPVAQVNPETSPNRVKQSNVIIDGGMVKSLLYGGGQGNDCTDKAIITVNDMQASENWSIGSGSNGYTGDSELIINGGELNIVHTLNRGWGKTGKIVVNGGTINKLFPVSEEADTQTDIMEFHGITEAAVLEINAGTVKELLPGFNNRNAVEANDPIVSINVAAGAVVENIEDAKVAFGESLVVAE
ncbi:MAG: hypothetical protein IKA36_04915 [Clostridia bacterium]|nr:hypothetical protein [Clostridia bacterium]